ncbi:MAG: SRPBCC family protein [Acidimicrobiia bacterium]
MAGIPNISGSVTINAPKSVVWSILDDFSNIQDWTDQVKTSVQLGDVSEGLGAGRSCELAPFGTTDEKIIEYVPEDKMVIELTNIKKVPISRSVTTFALTEIDANTTEVSMSPVPEPKGGPVAGLVAKRLEKSLPKAINSLLADLKAASESKAQAAA